MDHDSVSEHGGRVERSTRLAGALLLVGAVLAVYVTDLLVSRSPHRVELFKAYDVAVFVLAPAGAMLLAVSLAIRALMRPFSSPTPRTQLGVGIALLCVGLLHMAYGPQILAAITDFLGATANAGILIVEVLSRVVGLTALPLGIAVLATQPLVRLARPGRRTPCQRDRRTSRPWTSVFRSGTCERAGSCTAAAGR